MFQIFNLIRAIAFLSFAASAMFAPQFVAAQVRQTSGNLIFRQTANGAVEILLGNKLIYTRRKITVKTANGARSEFPLKLENNRISADLGEYGFYSETLQTNRNAASGNVELTVRTAEPFLVECDFEFEKTGNAPYFMIPGVLYGTNNLKSGGDQPKLDYAGKIGGANDSISSKFSTRSDRSSHPGVITVDDKIVRLVGVREIMRGAEYESKDVYESRFVNTGLLLDTSEKTKDVVGFTLGYEHFPRRYKGKVPFEKAPQANRYRFGWIKNLTGKRLSVKTFYFADAAKDLRDSAKAVRAYYYNLHESPAKRATRQEALEKLTRAQTDDAFLPDRRIFYVTAKNPGEGDIAWTGGMQNAYPLLKAALKLKDRRAEAAATAFIDNLTNNAMNERANLFYEANVNGKWQVTGWWNYPNHTAYLNGQASYYVLKSYELTGRKNRKWLDAARDVIDTAVKSQNRDGAYAAQFDAANGRGIIYDEFQGAWFAPGAALLAKITGEKRYETSASKALRHYNEWHKRGELYGTPMDTKNAVDEEGNLAFIVGCAELHKLTNNPEILRMAKDALDWEWTWKFAYNTVHTNEPLRALKWSSAGGSITSTHNVHIHAMGNLVAGEIYYFSTKLPDQYIADRLRDTCIWGLGTFNRFDGEFGFGKTGWATEQFFHSDAVQDVNEPFDGGVWYDFLPWSAACILLNVTENIPNRFFEGN